jgi:hypothetical protein
MDITIHCTWILHCTRSVCTFVQLYPWLYNDYVKQLGRCVQYLRFPPNQVEPHTPQHDQISCKWWSLLNTPMYILTFFKVVLCLCYCISLSLQVALCVWYSINFTVKFPELKFQSLFEHNSISTVGKLKRHYCDLKLVCLTQNLAGRYIETLYMYMNCVAPKHTF